MQIVKRGTKGKSFFLGGTKKTTSQLAGRYLQHNPEKTNNGIHLKVEWTSHDCKLKIIRLVGEEAAQS